MNGKHTGLEWGLTLLVFVVQLDELAAQQRQDGAEVQALATGCATLALTRDAAAAHLADQRSLAADVAESAVDQYTQAWAVDSVRHSQSLRAEDNLLTSFHANFCVNEIIQDATCNTTHACSWCSHPVLAALSDVWVFQFCARRCASWS